MREHELFKALRALYPARTHALLPQVAMGTGYDARGHADAVAVSLWPSRGIFLEGFEIKCSRADWLRELKKPEKADGFFRWCKHWWVVVADPTFVRVEELPPGWGLLAWDAKHAGLRAAAKAPTLNPETPTLSFLAAVMRAAAEHVPSEETLAAEYAKGRDAGERAVPELRRELDTLRERVAEFEATAGVTIDAWDHGHIGVAVRAVLDERSGALVGKLQWERQQLAEVLAHYDKVLAAAKTRTGKKT